MNKSFRIKKYLYFYFILYNILIDSTDNLKKIYMSQHTISRTLSKAILKPEVRIKLKIWNTYLTGKLVRFDNYMNLIVENAKEIYFGRGGKRSKDLGTVMIRGASIILIGQDREKLIFTEAETETEHDKLMHRDEFEED
jgi:small nuclear ribonucleoprotein (snRNP)-like protein